MAGLRYPNETQAYRDARDLLLKEEQALVERGWSQIALVSGAGASGRSAEPGHAAAAFPV